MGSTGTVGLKTVWAMLGHCAPGYTVKQTKHYWQITYAGRTYPSFPLGKHGKRENPPIQVGHVKRMVRYFSILDCAKGVIEQLE